MPAKSHCVKFGMATAFAKNIAQHPPHTHTNHLSTQRPADWRLACQTIVGDGERGGRVTIVTKPQG